MFQRNMITLSSSCFNVFQELISERDTGFAKLNQAIEAGEKLYPNTATDGREKIRQELRQHKLTWESLADDLSSAQRKLEVALVQWTTFDDSYGQVEQWLRDAEVQLEGQVPLRSTLEEKKSQLQNFKVLHQDVLSYQRVIDSVDDKARTLVQSSSDQQLSNFVSQTGARYTKLCSLAKVSSHYKFYILPITLSKYQYSGYEYLLFVPVCYYIVKLRRFRVIIMLKVVTTSALK